MSEIVYYNADNKLYFRKYAEEDGLWVMQKINFIRLNGKLEELHSQLIQTVGIKVNPAMIDITFSQLPHEEMIKRINGE